METNEVKRTIWWGVFIIAALILFITNPNEEELRTRLGADGWWPTEINRSNLLLFSANEITGFTGAKAVYIGIGGHYFQVGEP